MFDTADQEVVRYRAISSLAMIALLAGLLSPLAMLATSLWLVPLTAVVIAGLALWRIASRAPELIGRPAALVGLMLGVAFLIASPVDDIVYRYCLRRQAREFAGMWIDAIRHKELYKAHHLTVDPKHRLPLESKLADFYDQNETWHRSLNTFRNEATIRTLYRLGEDANIRFYETAAEGHEDVFDFVKQIYAVSFPDEHKKPKSFFISLLLQRSVDAGTGRAGWTLKRVEGGIRPAGW